MNNPILFALIFVGLLGSGYYFWQAFSRLAKIQAQAENSNPVFDGYAGIKESGKLQLLKSAKLSVSNEKVTVTNKNGEVLLSGEPSKLTLKQGGLIYWTQIQLTDGTKTLSFSPYPLLGSRNGGGLLMQTKVYIPARNIISKSLTDHGVKVAADSVN